MVTGSDEARWDALARSVTITRDDWGIAHVRGESDAAAVFGMIYAQAEDDFDRIEINYLRALGRLATVEGSPALFRDLRQRLFVEEGDLRARHAASPAWLKRLTEAWADGLNFFLATHPGNRPRALHRFEPWMALSFPEGSIGGDIERISLADLETFYGTSNGPAAAPPAFEESIGSNGIAIAPANTRDGHALLLINPHSDFHFRAELQMESAEGLNAYGTATWGQFFLYQGFNERAGWMHTTTGADSVDEFREAIVRRGGGYFYRHGDEERAVETREVEIDCRRADGGIDRHVFAVHRTHHGPVVRTEGHDWVTVALMYKPAESLAQGFLRMKALDYPAFLEVAALKANSYANTIYADADGTIAYLHPSFVAARDERFDRTRPVDGADPAADWRGEHALDELPTVVDPPNGWISNTNNWPYSAAGPNSPKLADFPRYMDRAGENPRGEAAVRLLTGRTGLTLRGLVDLAYDPYLIAFADLLPLLLSVGPDDPVGAGRHELAEQLAILTAWDLRWSADSVATTLAIFWGEEFLRKVEPAPVSTGPAIAAIRRLVAAASPDEKLDALGRACALLTSRFGTWRVPWGEVNRFQRSTGVVEPRFDDGAPSVPVPFTSGLWGSLAVTIAREFDQRRRYAISGNSFVAAVQFGERVTALAANAGGASGDPRSPHYNDQTEACLSGTLRPVYFYPEDLDGHIEAQYRPGASPRASAGQGTAS